MRLPTNTWISATSLFQSPGRKHSLLLTSKRLWEQSWEDGAVKFQVEPEMAYDASKIHKIHFDGKHHRCHAYAQTHPSPQRSPVIFQAGASKAGIDFAGKHAEAIYTDNSTIASLAEYVRDVRAACVRHGRDPRSVKIFMAMAPIVAKTQEEAQAKHDKAKSLASIQAGLAKFSGYTNVDLSKYPLKEPFNTELTHADNQVAGVIKNYSLKQKEATEPFTPEYIGKMAGFGSTPKPTGTPERVADILEDWFHKTDIDGFNLVCK
jgi:alkanesulfonate monooxygenase SsuD/methylene tetrahydromethanopterin reductase-like flavin-dependent oxidoreductase (luciferase family)